MTESTKDTQDTQDKLTFVWQRRLRPVMVVFLVVLAIFFFGASGYQLYYVQQRTANAPKLDPGLSKKLQHMLTGRGVEALKAPRMLARVSLESHVLNRRYHQANTMLMARTWITYLGFVTGMVLALIGAVFILGKLREESSKLEAEGMFGKANLTTSSPGIILCVLGTILMLTTMLKHNQIKTDDEPIYFGRYSAADDRYMERPVPQKPDQAFDKIKADRAKKGAVKDRTGSGKAPDKKPAADKPKDTKGVAK